MSRLLLLLAGLAMLVPVVGCIQGTRPSTADLEREKISMEVMNAQRQELNSLINTQQQLRAKNEKALRDLDRRRTELQGMEQDLQKKQLALQSSMAKANAKLKQVEDRLNSREKELQTLEAKNQQQLEQIAAWKKEVAARRPAAPSEISPVASSTIAKAQQAEQDQRQREAQQKQAREKYLESLADATIGVVKNVPIGSGYQFPQRTREELMTRLNALRPASSEQQFRDNANRTAVQFALHVTNGTLTDSERAAIRNFGYQEAGKQPAGAAH